VFLEAGDVIASDIHGAKIRYMNLTKDVSTRPVLRVCMTFGEGGTKIGEHHTHNHCHKLVAISNF
jgi:hypothetical protein